MKAVHFSTLDLNLLRLFDALYEERNVTRAGRRLNLTQSAVSHALNRLRYALDDELFVRGADGMNPTPLAAEIWPEVRRGLQQLQLALGPGAFVPAQTDRRFNLAAPPTIASTLLPRAVARFREEAPEADLRIRGLNFDFVAGLETGAVDLAIGAFGRVSDNLSREILLEERMVWAMRADHPAAGRPLTLEALSELPLLVLAIGEHRVGDVRVGLERQVMIDDGGAWERALGGRTARRRVAVTADDTYAALAMLADTDLVGLVPRRVAAGWGGRGLKLFDPPYESLPLAVEALWREDRGANPAVAWLLGLIRDAARELAQGG